MDTATKAAGIADTPDPTADPSRDVELGHILRPLQNPSRVSLPLSHRRSFSIAGGRPRPESTTDGQPSSLAYEDNTPDTRGLPDGDDELPWGPSHPCYPHLNPHVPINSPLYESTRIVRIKRDWMLAGDLAPTFSHLYPEILDPGMPEGSFREVVQHVNEELIAAFSPWSFRAGFDAWIGALTGWLWEDLGFTGVRRRLKALDTWVERWNREVGEPEGISIIPLRRTAYLSLDIQIPDPQIEVDGAATERRGSMQRHSFRGHTLASSRQASISSLNTAGSLKRPAAAVVVETEYGAYPVVPPIPGKYLEEAQQHVQQYAQQTGLGHVEAHTATAR